VLREDGRLIPTTHYELTQRPVHSRGAGFAEQARNYVRRHWKYCEPKLSFGPSPDLLERAQSHFLCVSGMAFQDAWNIDLERLRQCCVHVLTTAHKLIPFCAYYLTDTRGRRLFDQRAR